MTVKAAGSEEPEPEVTLTSITVTPPTKLEYTAGEELDTAGMTVTAVYSDGTEKDVTDAAVLSGYDKDAEGTQTIKVTYTENDVEVSAEFTVTVKTAGSEEPGTEEPGTEEPGTDKPSTDKPSADKPSTDKPSADKPSADSGKDTASAVQTGDTTNLLVPAIVAVIALAAAAAVIIIRKKRK